MKAPTNARPTPTAIAPRLPYRLARLANHMRSVADFCEREAGRGGKDIWHNRATALRDLGSSAAFWAEESTNEAAARPTEKGDE